MNRFRFLVKSVVHGALELSGRPRRQRKKLCGRLIILTYHSFCTGWPRGLFNSLPVDRFEQQIRFLKKNFKLVSLEQGLHHLQQRYVDEQPWVAITIDDGFRDNFTHAWPVLQRYAVPATIFLATDFIDTGRPPWPTQLAEILETTQQQQMELPIQAELKSLSARSLVVRQLKKALSPLPPGLRFEQLAALRSHLRVGGETQYPPLTWDQVREMQNGGLHFGAHTAYHSILPAVDPMIMMPELRDSKRRIEAEVQEACVLFAYPDGKHSEASRTALESCGYQVAVTQDFGCNDELIGRLKLKRIEVPFDDPMPSFRARVSLSLHLG